MTGTPEDMIAEMPKAIAALSQTSPCWSFHILGFESAWPADWESACKLQSEQPVSTMIASMIRDLLNVSGTLSSGSGEDVLENTCTIDQIIDSDLKSGHIWSAIWSQHLSRHLIAAAMAAVFTIHKSATIPPGCD
jgi:hypothetical protein